MHYHQPSLALFLLIAKLIHAQYILQTDYFQTGFFDSFDFFDGPDPTNGFVQYQGRDDSLISSSRSSAHMRVSTEQSTPGGRPSIRITSKESYKTGLIILDLAHMPGGICGTWPAFWTVGPNWPNGGEIDIIEGVNDAQTNQMTLHTGDDCTISATKMTGSIYTSDCDVSSGNNTGCAITTNNAATFGSAFNSNGGGVYATSITSSNIIVWFWARSSIPEDIINNSPDPLTWPAPLANFSGPCDFDSSFAAQNIVFDTTFCGDWAGDAWPQSGCAALADTCQDYVANNGADFRDAYWAINGLKVYQSSDESQSSPSLTPSRASLSAASSILSATTTSDTPPTTESSTSTLVASSELTASLPTFTTQAIGKISATFRSFTPSVSSPSTLIRETFGPHSWPSGLHVQPPARPSYFAA